MISLDWPVRLAFAGAIVAAGFGLWAWRYQQGLDDGHKDRDIAVAAVQRAWDSDRLRRSAETLRLVTEAVAERNAQQKRADDAERAHLDAKAQIERLAADLAAAGDRMRNAIQAYAAGPGDSGNAAADLAACRQRAGALGGLLDEALQTSAVCAANGEADRAAARALWDAWPTGAMSP